MTRCIKARREVVYFLISVHHVHEAIVVVVVVGAFGGIGGQEEVVSPQTVTLGVLVGEDTGLQKFIVRVMDAGHHQSGAEGKLFVFQEEVIGVSVQHHAPHGVQRESIFRPNLGDIQGIKLKLIFIRRVHGLNAQGPLGVLPTSNGVVQILGGVGVILPPHQHRLIVQQHLHPTSGFPVEFHQRLTSFFVDQHKGVNAEAFDVAVVLGDAQVIEQKGEHVHRLWDVTEKIGNPPPLLNVVFGVGLQGVYHVGELHAIADEKDGNVVSYEVEVAFARVKLNGKASRVTQGFWRAAFVDDGGETDDDGGLDAWGSQKIGAGEVGDVVGYLEKAFGRGTTGMDYALWDAFAVEIGYFLCELVVFQKDWAWGGGGWEGGGW